MDDNVYESVGNFVGGLVGLVVFVGSWIYCISTYGFLLGVGLGWLPSAICAVIAGGLARFLWPLLVLGIMWLLSQVLLPH